MDTENLKLANQFCFPVYAASRLIIKAYKPFLDTLGVTYPQYLVLLVLWENDKVNVTQIMERLLLESNTLTPLLKRMEKNGLINRNRSVLDERSVIIGLTEKGKNLKKSALTIPVEIFERLKSENLKIEDIVHLKEVLCKLVDLLKNKEPHQTKA